MAGYDDTKQKIISTLMGRPQGTEIQPEQHQDYALSMLNYIRSLELISTNTLIGIAKQTTVPVQPNNARACYIAGVAQNQTATFDNFIGQDGNPIQVTTDKTSGVFVILMWNTQYWDAEVIPTSIISQAAQAFYYYNINVRKTYTSVEDMNGDNYNPVGDDGRQIELGEIVSVVNSENPEENGFYSRTENGWQFQTGFNFQVANSFGESGNDAISQRFFTEKVKNVSNGSIDITNGYSVLDDYNTPEKTGIYVLLKSNSPAYQMIVTSDDMSHVVTQWIFGNLILNNGTIIGHSDYLHTVIVRTYNISGGIPDLDKGTWSKWEYLINSQTKYIQKILWSGEIVEDVDVNEISIPGLSNTANIVYDTVKKTFLYHRDNMYLNYWDTLSDYQENVYTAASPFVAGFKNDTIYKSLNNDVWIAISQSELEKIAGNSEGVYPTVMFAGILDDSETVIYGSTMTEATEYDVWYSPKARSFAVKVPVKNESEEITGYSYYTNWANSDKWNTDFTGSIGTGNPRIARDKTYFISIATGIQYLFSDNLFRPTSATGGGGGSIIIDDTMSEVSENAVQNKVITKTLMNMFTWHDAQPLQTNAVSAEKTSNWKNK